MPNEIYHKSNWGNANAGEFGDVYFDAAATNKLYNHSDYYENSNGTDKILRDLSNKASIVLTPTAYSDGSLNTVIPPYQVLPTELVTNGDFSNGTTSWTLDDASNGSISVVDGKLEIVSNGGAGYPVVKQGILTSIGKKYSVTFSVTNNTTGFWFRVSQFESSLSGDTTFYANDKTLSINFKGEFTAISTTSYLKIFAEQNDAGSFEIDNISIKEIQEADFDFSRGSSATRVNEQGLIESIASGLPRIDYTSGFGSLLLEPQRQNSYNYSEPTSNEGTSSGITYESFDWSLGFTNCVKFGDNSAVRFRYGASVAASTQYTISAFVIMDDLSEPEPSTSSILGDFSFVVGGSTSGTVNQNISYGNNIYKVSATITSGTKANNNGIVKYTTQSSKGFRVVGWQVEQGSYATSYIVSNSGSATTRSADVANNSGNADLFNDSEGVLYAEIAALANDSTNRKIAIGTSSNRIIFGYKNSSNQVRVEVISSGSAVFDSTQAIDDVTTFSKFAIKYKQNDFALWMNGQEIAIDTSGNTPIGLSELAFDDGGSNNFYGNVKCVAVFKEALTDAELQQLTS